MVSWSSSLYVDGWCLYFVELMDLVLVVSRLSGLSPRPLGLGLRRFVICRL